jgi:hypothetical protein
LHTAFTLDLLVCSSKVANVASWTNLLLVALVRKECAHDKLSSRAECILELLGSLNAFSAFGILKMIESVLDPLKAGGFLK